MSLLDLLALFGVMVALAALPGTSVLIVVSRAATHGFAHGAFAAAGIASGDLIFVLLALGGLGAAAQALGDAFVVARYLGGLYLIAFGVSLWRTKPAGPAARPPAASRPGSYLAGLLFTLGDLKAVFFYASLFPMFVDPRQMTSVDAIAIVTVSVATVAAVKLGYAYAAHRVRGLGVVSGRGAPLRKAVSGLLIGTGVAMIVRA